jgi:competence protein ComGC
MTSAEKASVQNRFQPSLGRVNIILAALAVLVLLFVPLFRKSEDEFALAAMAAIFAVAVVLEQIAARKLRSVAVDPEIETLLDDATEIIKDGQPATAPDLSLATTMVSLWGAGLCWTTGVAMAVIPSNPPRSLWSAVVAVLIGEAIYLSYCFEQAARQVELEKLARAWKAMSSAKLSRLWAARAIDLSDALGRPRKKKPEPT